MSDIALVPYALVDGRWTVSDDCLRLIAKRMSDEGLFARVFYDGSVRTADEFVRYMQRRQNVPIFFFEGDEPLGFGWLNGIRDGKAFAHFCTLKSAKGKTLHMGRLALAYWFYAFDFIAVILGLIAAHNLLAIRFVRRIGFTFVGEIPALINDVYLGQRVPGAVVYCAR